MFEKIEYLIVLVRNFIKLVLRDENKKLAIGCLLSNQQFLIDSKNINDYEFKIFSQWGDDGIIQYLSKNLDFENHTFIEFGTEDYHESNTRFLLMNNNWSGYIIDGSSKAIKKLKNQFWFWKYDLRCKAAFITRDNINDLLSESKFQNIGILSIDIDGNDYHILKEINFTTLNPSLIIIEYNSVFGKDRCITVPYDKAFNRTTAHYSNLFFGASLPALNILASQKGYSLICCTKAGNNAYFVRNDLLNNKVTKKQVEKAYIPSKSREARNKNNKLSYLSGEERLEIIKGLDVLNIQTNQIEQL